MVNPDTHTHKITHTHTYTHTYTQVNLSAYFAIQSTSSLTFKVAGCLKNLGVILYGVFFMLESVTPVQFMGYGTSVAGFALYTHTQLQRLTASNKQ